MLIFVIFVIFAALSAQAWGSFAFVAWLYQLAIAIDQLLNVVLTPFHSGAWADETLSSRAYRMHAAGKPWGRFWMPLIDRLFFWQEGHCKAAFEKERQRVHTPPEGRQ